MKQLIIKAVEKNGAVKEMAKIVDSGKATIVAESGARYYVVDDQGKQVKGLGLKRKGKDLLIDDELGNKHVVITDYFDGVRCSGNSSCQDPNSSENNTDCDWLYYSIGANNADGLICASADPTAAALAAGALATEAVASTSSTSWVPFTLGAIAVVGGATALAASGGGSSHNPSPSNPNPPATPAAPTSYKDDVGPIQGNTSTAATTDDTTPGINVGTGLQGVPTLYIDGVKVPSTYDPLTGTLTPTGKLPEGTHVFTFTLTGSDGGESNQSPGLRIVIDTTPPATPAAPTSYNDDVGPVQSIHSTATVTDDTTPGIDIGTGITDTPCLYVDGVKVPATYNPTTGTLTPTAAIPLGAHTITYTLTDPAGNESNPSGGLHLTIATGSSGIPTAPTSYKDDVGPIQSNTSTATVTDDSRPGINIGTGLTDTPCLYVDGVKVPATYDPTSGTLTPTAALGEGLHTCTYSLIGADGSESGQSTGITITIDTTAPTTPTTAITSYKDDVGPIQSNTSTAAVTDDTRPGFHVGTGLTNTPNLYVDGTKVAATYDATAGTLTPNVALGEGIHAVTYSLSDTAGNESGQSPAFNLTIDTTAPTTPTTAITSYKDDVGAEQSNTSTATTTDDARPGFNIGTALTNTPNLYVDGTKVAATYDATAGTLTPNAPLASGLHAITYSLSDTAGNESGRSPAFNLTIDNSAAPATPAAPTSYKDNVGPVQSDTSTATTTDDATPGLNIGTGLTNTPNLYVDGTKVAATYDATAGTLTPNTALSDGSHALTITLTNGTGHESSPSPAFNLTIDTGSSSSTPTAPTSYKDDVGPIQSNTSTAAVTDDARPGLNVATGLTNAPNLYVDGTKVAGAYDPATGTLTPDAPLSDGSHALTYTLITGSSGESGQSAAFNLTIDTAAPATPAMAITSYKDDVGAEQSNTSTATTTDDSRPGFNIGTGLTDTPNLYIDGTKVAATYSSAEGTLTPNAPLASGLHAVTYSLSDQAGNESGKSPAFNLTIDNSAAPAAPSAPTSYKDDVGPIQSNTSTAAATDDARPGLNIGTGRTDTPNLYVDGTKVAATYDSTAGTLTPDTALTDGSHALTYTLTNGTGHESSPSPAFNLTIDTAAPATPAAPTSYKDNVGAVQSDASTATTTDDATPGLNIGTGLTNTPNLYVDGTKVAATYDSTAGTLTPNTALTSGSHALTYTLTDAVGNESGRSPAFNLTIDTGSSSSTPTAPTSYKDDVGPIKSNTSTAAVTDDARPGLNIGTGRTDTPNLYVDGTKVAATYDSTAGTLTPNAALSDGPHALTYTLTNGSGSESSQSAAFNLTIDTAAPATPATAITSYKDDVGAEQSNTSTASTTDDTRPGFNIGIGLTDTPNLYVDGTKVAATYSSAEGTLTPNAPLASGLHAITYSLSDTAGNESGKSPAFNLTIDNSAAPATPPAPTSYKDNVGDVQSDTSTASTTDDATPGLNIGTSLTNTPNLYVDGTKVDATYDATAGTLTPDDPISDGNHDLAYTLTNGTGNESSPSPAFNLTIDTGSGSNAPDAPTSYKDNVGPVQSDTSTASTTDDATPGLNIGTGLTDTPNLYVDGTKVDSTYDATAGTLTPNTALTDGKHDLTYTLTNAAGTETDESDAFTLTIDTGTGSNAPDAPTSYKDNVGPVQSDTSTASTTDDATPGLNIGTGLTDTPNLYVDGTKVDSTYDATAGTLTPNTALTDGEHDLTYTLTDADGNETDESDTFTLTIDTGSGSNAPDAPTSYKDNVGPVQSDTSTASTTDDATPGLNIGTGLTDTPNLYVDGTKVASTYDSTGGTLTPNTALSNGKHDLTYTLTDADGNETDESDAFTLTIATDQGLDLGGVGTTVGGFKLKGQVIGDSSGYSVAAAGDVNGDGYADVIVGAPGNDASGTDAGRSYLVFGKADTTDVDLNAVASGTGGFVINGQAAGDNSGISVSGLGDVNGDGLADLIVGARFNDTTATDAGRSYVVFGKSTTAAVDLSAIAAGTGGFVLNGESTTDANGFSVSSAGDVNSDGFVDLIVSSPFLDDGAKTEIGRSYVVFGKSTTTAVNLSDITAGTGGFAMKGSELLGVSGISVSAAGDVNGDGLSDLIVGATGDDGQAANSGRAYVVFGKTDATTVNLLDVAGGTGGFVLNGQAMTDSCGISVSGAGDVNGDGIADLIVGANLADPGGRANAGSAYVVFGKSNSTAINLSDVAGGTGGFAINGAAADDNGGVSVANAGDLNGDGLSDLIVGADLADPSGRANAGSAYVVFGKNNTTAINLSDVAAGTGGFVLNGAAAGDMSGFCVATAGDVNGDGIGDLVIGSNTNGTTTKTEVDHSYVIFGGSQTGFNADFLGTSAGETLTGTSAGETFVGGDGIDIIIGNGGADVMYGGKGNDVFVLNADNVAKLAAGITGDQLAAINGGTGVDRIRLEGGANLNLTSTNHIAAGSPELSDRISSIERIDLLTDTTANTLTLSIQDVVGMCGMNTFNSSHLWTGLDATVNRHQLLIDGNGVDNLVLQSGEFELAGTASYDGLEYAIYNSTSGNAQLLVFNLINVTGAGDSNAPDAPTSYKDNVGDVQSDTSTAATTDDATPGLNIGTGLTDTPNLYVDGTKVNSTYDSTAGTLTPDTALTNGKHDLTYTLTDADGNETDESDAFTLTIDTGTGGNAPEAISSYKDNVGPVQNDTSTAFITDDATPGFNVGTGLTDTPNLYVDGTKVNSTYDSTAGTLTPDTALSDGKHDLTYTLTDADGNETDKSDAFTLTISTSTQGIDLGNVGTTAEGFRIDGQVVGDSSGYSVAGAGDVNGDGYDDLIVGAPGNDATATDAGRSYVVFGKANNTTVDLNAVAAGTGGFAINGEAASDNCGISVSVLGDVNGDGLADLIVGARFNDTTATDAGRSYVVFGKASTTAVDLTAIAAGTGGFVLNGETTTDANGLSVSSAGDVNGDGFVDLIVSSPFLDDGANNDIGRSYVVFGKSTTTAVNLSDITAGTGGFAMKGTELLGLSGVSVSAAGDVNGDGLSDLIVGATGDDGHAANSGRAYVVFGKTDTTTVNLLDVAGGAGGFVLNGQAMNDNCGISVSGAGDVNGDGLADLIVGAYSSDPPSASNAGRAYVVFGSASTSAIDLTNVAAGTGGFAINGAASGDNCGVSVANAGDLNGDGLSDLFVGADWFDPSGRVNAGGAYVVFGKTGTTAINLSDVAGGTGGFLLNGAAAGDMSGFSVSSAGDVNGDGIDDLVIGASPNDTTPKTEVDHSYVVFGGSQTGFTADFTGTNADNNLAGTSASETFVGGAGIDIIRGNGGADVMYGGLGNDIFVLNADNITHLAAGVTDGKVAMVNGGAGYDTIRIIGGANLDLTTISNIAASSPELTSRIKSIEHIDMNTDTEANTLTVSIKDVVDMSGINTFNSTNGWTGLDATVSRHQIVIDGDSQDTVSLPSGAFTLAGSTTYDSYSYDVYNSTTGNAQLLVNHLTHVI